MNISSIAGSVIGKVSPYMLYIKIAVIVVVLVVIGGLYENGKHLSGKVDDLNKQNGVLTTQLKVAHDANDTEEATIKALGLANDQWATIHKNDVERLDVLTARAADLTASLNQQFSALAKLQSEDYRNDPQKILSIDLNAAVPELAQRLRDEQRALYQDGDAASVSAGSDSLTEISIQPLPAKTEAP